MALLSESRADYLHSQVFLTLVNDGEFYKRCNRLVTGNAFNSFVAVVAKGASSIGVQRKLESELELAYVALELWIDWGGEQSGYIASLVQEGFGHHPKEISPNWTHKGEMERLFATAESVTFAPTDTSRHGCVYTSVEIANIKKMLERGDTIQEIATSAKRTALGVALRLCSLGLLERVSPSGDYLYMTVPKSRADNVITQADIEDIETQPETVKEKFMSVIATNPEIAIETRVVIFGQDAKSLSDQQLIDFIKRVEGDIAKLKEVKTKSKKIAANIEELEGNLAKIVEILDAR